MRIIVVIVFVGGTRSVSICFSVTVSVFVLFNVGVFVAGNQFVVIETVGPISVLSMIIHVVT